MSRPAFHVPEVEADIIAMVTTLAPRFRGSFDVFAERIRTEHFFGDLARKAWPICVELAESNQRPALALVIAKFRERHGIAPDQERWFTGLTPGKTDATPEDLARLLVDAWKQREIGWRLQEFVERCYGEAQPIEELVSGVVASVETVGRDGGVDDANDVTLADGIRDVFGKIAQYGSRMSAGVMTGLTDLDAKLGGLRPGSLIVVAGRPSMGKSSLAFQMGEAVAASDQHAGVSIFSLEMPNEQTISRMVCAAARVDLARFMNNQVREEEWDSLTRAARVLSLLPVRVCYATSPTPALIRGKARRHASEWAKSGVRPALIIVDYLGMMNVADLAGKGARHDQHIGAAVKSLKHLAVQLNVPVILCAQLNRGSGTERPQLNNLRDSGEIEQDADVVIFVHRPEHYQRDQTPPELRGIAELIVAKNRNGPTGVVRTVFFGAHTCFGNLSPSDDRWQEDM